MKKISLEEYKQLTVNLLFTIDEICKKNNLRYYIFYGTLLGAVRHKGFIPWDDDIDIAMPRSDYKKLSRIINEGTLNINFISIETNKDTIYPQAKICDTRTVLYEKNFKRVKGYGAFIDVFPLDYAPNDERLRLKEQKHLRHMIILATHSSRTGFFFTASKLTNIKRIGGFLIGKLINTQRIIEYINNYMEKRNNVITNYYRVFGGGIFKTAWFTDYNEVIFEGHKLSAPSDTDSVLKTSFGDYMKLPPKEEQVNKHSLECYYK